jgi:hypothetical protein
MRTALATALAAAVLLLGQPALAQQQQPPPAAQQHAPDQAAKDGAVVPGQAPQPTEQGTRAPTLTQTDTQSVTLSQALDQVWNAAVDLQGAPIPGPSMLATPGSGRQPPQPAISPSP